MSLGTQWLAFWASRRGAQALIPGRGSKIPHVVWSSQKRQKRKEEKAQAIRGAYAVLCTFDLQR